MEEEIVQGSLLPPNIKRIVNPTSIIIGGFSYGAATCVQALAKRPGKYAACVLLDGWYNIDFTVIPGLQAVGHVPFPPLAHQVKRLEAPCLFIGSESFAAMEALNAATKRLQEKCENPEILVLAGTRHQNFCDVWSWYPNWLMRRSGSIGPVDAHQTSNRIFETILSFLDANVHRSM